MSKKVETHKPRIIVCGTSPNEEKHLAIYKKLTNNKFQLLFGDTLKYKTITQEEFLQIRKKPRDYTHLLIRKDDKDLNMRQLNMEQQIKLIYEEGNYLKNLTSGRINLFKTGSTRKTAEQLFNDLCQKHDFPETIGEKETYILEKLKHGALIWGKKGFKGDLIHKYDICSQYPSIMASKTCKFALKAPEFFNMTKDDFLQKDNLSYGAYHVQVNSVIDPRLARENCLNWYTHIELNYMKHYLHYELELVEDGETNAMIYTNLTQASTIFEPFVTYLFKYKKQGIKQIKKYLNILWGALCKKNDIEVKCEEVFEDSVITMLKPKFKERKMMTNNFQDTICTVHKKEKKFETNYGRIQSFLVAYGRIKISRIILPNVENLIRTHTDSLFLTAPLIYDPKYVTLGNELGNLKFEGIGSCEVYNHSNYLFEEICETCGEYVESKQMNEHKKICCNK